MCKTSLCTPSVCTVRLHCAGQCCKHSLDSVGHSAVANPPAWPWENDPTWVGLRAQLSGVSEDLELLEFCAGAGTALNALRKLIGSRAVSVGQWDWEEELRPLLLSLHPPEEHDKVHTGSEADLTKLNADDLPLAHIIVAGPPCPPWSSLGKALSFDDDRAEVFTAVIEIIFKQARGGKLLFCP